MQRDACLALAEWQSLCTKPLSEHVETPEPHVFAHKLPCMHARARTGDTQKNTHTQGW